MGMADNGGVGEATKRPDDASNTNQTGQTTTNAVEKKRAIQQTPFPTAKPRFETHRRGSRSHESRFSTVSAIGRRCVATSGAAESRRRDAGGSMSLKWIAGEAETTGGLRSRAAAGG